MALSWSKILSSSSLKIVDLDLKTNNIAALYAPKLTKLHAWHLTFLMHILSIE